MNYITNIPLKYQKNSKNVAKYIYKESSILKLIFKIKMNSNKA